MLLDVLALVAGLVALVFAGDKLVQGAVALAERLRISPLIIGLTIVAFGTSAPELFISLQSALADNPGIALGNVVGSNVANILLVLGLPALIAPLRCHEPGVDYSNYAMVGATVLFMALMAGGTLGRIDGLILFVGLIAFIAFQFDAARKGRIPPPEIEAEVDPDAMGTRGIAAALLIGIVGLPLGAQLTITGATGLASAFGVSDAVIGLTVVAIGTSLPELITTVMAAIRRSNEVAIGNVIGSNVFNILSIVGITAIVVPMAVPAQIIASDMWVMLAVTLLLAVLTAFRVTLGKAAGAAMLAAYVAYLAIVYVVGEGAGLA